MSGDQSGERTVPSHGHPLKYGRPYYFKGFKCALCARTHGKGVHSWNCKQCGYNVCSTCLGGPDTMERIIAAHPHPVYLKQPVYASGGWVCDNCGAQKATTQMSWNCSLCEFDLCDGCIQLAVSGALTEIKGRPTESAPGRFPRRPGSSEALSSDEDQGGTRFQTKAHLREETLKALTNAAVIPIPPLLEIIESFLEPKKPRFGIYINIDMLIEKDRSRNSWELELETPNSKQWVEARIIETYLTAQQGWMVVAKEEESGMQIKAPRIFPDSSKSLAKFRTHTVDRVYFDDMVCRMLFPSSGRVGFGRLTVHPDTHPDLYETWTRLANKYAEEHTKQSAEEEVEETEEEEVFASEDRETKKEEDEEEEERKREEERNRRDFLMAMVKREAALRLSPYAQKEMDRYRHSESQVTVVTEGFQLQAIKEFGFHGRKQEQFGITLLQSASNMYPNHPQIRDTFYVKFNRCEPGNLFAGQECPDVPLYTPQGKKTSLLSYYQQLAITQCGFEEKSGSPAPLLVVVAGSST